MPWFYDSDSGKLVHEDPPSPGYYVYEAALHTGTGWHELTVADSATQAQAAAAAKALNLGPVQGSSTSIAQLGANEVGNLPAQVSGGAAASAIPGVAQIGTFFSALTQGNTWIRIAEGLLGIILIAVGVARITHVVPVATKIARAVA
jgi:hypothetical protein